MEYLDPLRWDVLWILKTVQKNVKCLLKISIFITCWNNIFGYLGKLLKNGRKKIYYYIIKNIYMARSGMYWENKFTGIPIEMRWNSTVHLLWIPKYYFTHDQNFLKSKVKSQLSKFTKMCFKILIVRLFLMRKPLQVKTNLLSIIYSVNYLY